MSLYSGSLTIHPLLPRISCPTLYLVRQHLPLTLPAPFFRAESPKPSRAPDPSDSRARPNLTGWIARLIWDPIVDDYDIAMAKTAERARQIEFSQGLS